ncbi:hypothetical protein [Methylobrevis albus]|uniref:Lipoprotein n=1 Tax=Methylobrevis albus TaxID=2793297 RepID=A0A931I301_9HYPH|nr:hypothetical protein [Methylobrevis albus]MBH0239295.1 hypothetical protein [Methylobrevis albus]
MTSAPRPTRRLILAGLGSLALAGCQSSSPSSTATAGAGGPVRLQAPPDATQPTRPPVPAGQASFRFDLVQGIPTNRADELAVSLGSRARARGLTLVRRGDPAASYRILGYLSAVGGDTGTNVSYVWDVMDSGNRRLYRVTGFELAGNADGDPWGGVTDTTLDAIAARTVEALAAWIDQPLPAAPATAAAPGIAI